MNFWVSDNKVYSDSLIGNILKYTNPKNTAIKVYTMVIANKKLLGSAMEKIPMLTNPGNIQLATLRKLPSGVI